MVFSYTCALVSVVIIVADIEELEQMDASEIYAKKLNAKEVLTPMSGEKFIFPIEDGTVKLSGGDSLSLSNSYFKSRALQRLSVKVFFYKFGLC